MADIEDVLVHAWNKDMINLKPAIDDIMAAKVAERMDSHVADVAASIFGNSNGDDAEGAEHDGSETELDTEENPDYEGTEDADEFETDDSE